MEEPLVSIIEEGNFNEDGGELGEKDWPAPHTNERLQALYEEIKAAAYFEKVFVETPEERRFAEIVAGQLDRRPIIVMVD